MCWMTSTECRQSCVRNPLKRFNKHWLAPAAATTLLSPISALAGSVDLSGFNQYGGQAVELQAPMEQLQVTSIG